MQYFYILVQSMRNSIYFYELCNTFISLNRICFILSYSCPEYKILLYISTEYALYFHTVVQNIKYFYILVQNMLYAFIQLYRI